MLGQVLKWGRAYFFQAGNVPWTEEDALAFKARVEWHIAKEAAAKAQPVEAAHVEE